MTLDHDGEHEDENIPRDGAMSEPIQDQDVDILHKPSDTSVAINDGPTLSSSIPSPSGHATSNITHDNPYNTPDGRPRYYRWLVLASTTIGILLVAVQQNALIVALPKLIADLDANFETIIWVLLTFGLFIASLTIAIGNLSDIVGRAKMFNVGWVFFVVGSLVCGFSKESKHGWDLVGYRIIQGFGACSVFSNSGAIMTDAFFPYNQVGLAMGVNQVASAFGSILGPVLGGVLATQWRWLFFLNVPIGGVVTIISIWYIRDRSVKVLLPEDKGKSQWAIIRSSVMHKFDWIGAVTSFCAVAAILLALTCSAAIPSIPRSGWIALYVVGFVLLVVFLLNEQYFVNMWAIPKLPLLALSMFTDRAFVIANIGALTAQFSRSVVLITSILFLQGPYKDDPFHAGIATIPLGVGILLSGFLSGILSDKIGRNLLQVVGPAVAALGALGLALVKLGTSYWLFALGLFVTGLGQALYASPNSATVMINVPASLRGVAAGFRAWTFMFSNTVGLIGAFAIAIKKLPFEALLVLFLYSEEDAAALPPGTNLLELNETIVSVLGTAYWTAFATVLFSSFISLLLPGPLIEMQKKPAAASDVPMTTVGAATSSANS